MANTSSQPSALSQTGFAMPGAPPAHAAGRGSATPLEALQTSAGPDVVEMAILYSMLNWCCCRQHDGIASNSNVHHCPKDVVCCHLMRLTVTTGVISAVSHDAA